jgi:hypothetical protein
MKRPTINLIFGMALMLTGCTTVGSWDQKTFEKHDFGARRKVDICVYLDSGVTQARAIELMRKWTDELGPKFGLDIRPQFQGSLERTAFWHNEILDQVTSVPLGPACDRVFYFVKYRGRDLAFQASGLALGMIGMPEVLGEVDDPTMTHGWAFAEINDLNGFLISPESITTHELYHLLGSCPHSLSLDT